MFVRILIGRGGQPRHLMTDISSYVVENSYNIRHTIYAEVDSLSIELQDDRIMGATGLYMKQG